MVQAVTEHPPLDAALESHAAHPSEDDPGRRRRSISSVRPQAMVAKGDTETSELPADEAQDGRLPAELTPRRQDKHAV